MPYIIRNVTMPNLTRWCKFSPCKKIESRRVAKNFGDFFGCYFDIVVRFVSQNLARTYYQCLEFVTTTHVFQFSTQNQDMCYGIIGSNMIEIQPQPDRNSNTLINCPYRVPYSWLGIGTSTICVALFSPLLAWAIWVVIYCQEGI